MQEFTEINSNAVGDTVSVYYNQTITYLRGYCVDNFLISLAGFQCKRDVYYKKELPHPVCVFDLNILDQITIETGKFLTFEVGGVIVLKCIVNKVVINIVNFTVTVDASDIVSIMDGFDCVDVSQEITESELPPHTINELSFDFNDEKGNYIQILFLLKIMVVLKLGINENHVVITGADKYSGYIADVYQPAFVKNEDMHLNLTMLRAIGKASEDDTKSLSMQTFFLLLLQVMKYKYTYADGVVYLSPYSNTSVAPTIEGYSYLDIAVNGVSAEFETIDTSELVASDDLFNLYVSGWSGTQTIEFKPFDYKQKKISFPANFYIFWYYDEEIHHFSYVDYCWASDSGFFYQFCDVLFNDIYTSAANQLRRINIVNQIKWDTNLHTCKIDLQNSNSPITYHTNEG